MNTYEQKQAARAAAKRARAEKLQAEGERLAHKHDALLGVMNGTPILVGHHSERRHRRDMERIANDTRKSIEAREKAEALRRQADAIESSLAISSDDPDAVAKLRAKIETADAAEARRLRARVAEIEKRAAHVDRRVEFPGGVIEECAADNRTRITFDARPDTDAVKALKGSGFRWTPSLGVWQRQMTEAAWWAARRVCGVQS